MKLKNVYRQDQTLHIYWGKPMINAFSPNMLKTFETCPKKFYFKYIKNIAMPTNDEIFELGKNIHAMASYYLKKENIDRLEMVLTSQEKNMWEYLKNNEYFSFEKINTEYNLSVKIGEYFYGGRLDGLVKNDNKYYILDYKTGSIPKNAKYDFQTIIYTLAVSEFYKTQDVIFVYLDLKNKTEFKIELNEKLSNEYKQRLIDITDKIKEEDYTKISGNCNCEYNIICY